MLQLGMIIVALAAILYGSMTPTSDDEVVVAGAYYPEGLFWDSKTSSLFYTEMRRDRVSRLVVGGPDEIFVIEHGCGPTAIGRAMGFMVIACHLGDYLLITDSDGLPQQRIRVDQSGELVDDPNGIASDGEGVFVTNSGDFSPSSPATGAVLYWRPGEPVRRLADNLHYANGVVVDHARRRLFVSEHLARRVVAFPIQDDHGLGEPTVFANPSISSADHPSTGPDGLALDAKGRVYAAIYGAGRVDVFDPDGRQVGAFDRPERYVTTVAVVEHQPYLFVGGPFTNHYLPNRGQVSRVPLASMTMMNR